MNTCHQQIVNTHKPESQISVKVIKDEPNCFCRVYHKNTLDKIKFKNNTYFDTDNIFNGNEELWFDKLLSINGKAIIVKSSYIYRYFST